MCLLVLSADNLCKRAWSGSKLFDTQIVFLKVFFENVNFEKSAVDQNHEKLDNFEPRNVISNNVAF